MNQLHMFGDRPSDFVQIGGVEITTDSEGRFNLNSLHKASKLGVEKAPAQWLRNKQTVELIRELENETMQICTVSTEGRNGGTFAHELLAVSYAGWISPSFQLKVNQAFIDMKTGKTVKPLTTTETLIHMLQLQAEVERRQAASEQAIEVLRGRVGMVEQAQILTSRPANAESITHIRERIGRKYGLSSDTIDQVIFQSPYAPKPAGMVANTHEQADGAKYAVWWQKDVTTIFDRFIKESHPVTEQFFNHPFIQTRFKMRRP